MSSSGQDQRLLNEVELRDVLLVVDAILDNHAAGDMDLLSYLDPMHKRQLWDALTPQQRSGLSKLKEVKAA